MFLQERYEFFLKTPFAMMFRLRLDVCDRVCFLRDAYRECAVSLLPREILVWVSLIQREDAPLINCIAFASGISAGKDNRMCT